MILPSTSLPCCTLITFPLAATRTLSSSSTPFHTLPVVQPCTVTRLLLLLMVLLLLVPMLVLLFTDA